MSDATNSSSSSPPEPQGELVIRTIAMPADTNSNGDIVSCHAAHQKTGHTSMRIAVEAWAQRHDDNKHVRVTRGTFTYVALDDHGRPQPVNRS